MMGMQCRWEREVVCGYIEHLAHEPSWLVQQIHKNKFQGKRLIVSKPRHGIQGVRSSFASIHPRIEGIDR